MKYPGSLMYSSPHAHTCSVIASGCLRLDEFLLLGLEVCKQFNWQWLPTTGFYSFRHFNRCSQTGVRKWCKSNPFLFIVFVMIIGLAISLIIILLWILCLQTLDLTSLSVRGIITRLSLCQSQLCTAMFSGWILLILAQLLQTCISSVWEFVYSASEIAFVKFTVLQ